MKHAYLSPFKHFVYAAALLLTAPAFAQQPADAPRPFITPQSRNTVATTIGDDGQPHAFNPNGGTYPQGMGCDSLLSTLAMGNGNNGIMFDVVANIDIHVTFIDAVLYGTTGYVYIYHRPGSHVTHENSAAGWTLADSVLMTLTSQDSLYRIPIYVNLGIQTGDTTGFFVTGDANLSVDYTNGTAVGNVISQDVGMKVLEGTGITYPFATTFAPRNFNGYISYCATGIEPCMLTTTTYAGGNGFDGNMFDIYTSNDITINGFSGHVNGAGYMRIYYHMGTYVGTETNAGAWTLIDSAYVTSAGTGVPTSIPISMTLTIPAGSTVAFYITGTASGAAVDYTNGTAVGNVYAADGVIEIKEGQGCGYPFTSGATPRIWNGTVDYCLGIMGIADETASGISSTLYPNPVTGVSTLSIISEQPLQDAQVVITDVTGRVVETKSNVSSNVVEINAASFAPGMYFYTVYEGGAALTTGKFITE